MKNIPILFNTEMVRAILAGEKTQTRRIAKYSAQRVYDFACADGKWYETYNPKNPPGHLIEWYLSMGTVGPYMIGDVLWVRETWSTHYDGIHPDLVYCYKADGINLKAECAPGENNRWYPSIHMPREAARIFLKVKDVRVERVQDISFEDCKQEGIWDDYKTYSAEYHDNLAKVAYPRCFAQLWDSTIKPVDIERFGWAANPWVWVITFERCDKPEGW